jgi:hypothetical protein
MWTIGDRVIGRRTAEEFWYPGTIRHSDGSRFYVIFADGEDALLGAEQLRPLQLRVGDLVFARKQDNRDYQPARLTEQAEDRLLLTYTDGERAWTALGLVRFQTPGRKGTAVTPRAGASPGPSRWGVCDRVLACWLDLDWYPGVVLAAEDDRVHVLFDTGTQAPVSLDKVRPLDIAVGERVLCRRWNGPEYLTGEIVRVDGEKVRIRFDEGEEEWTSLRLLRLQRDEWLPGGGLEHFTVGERVLACWYDLFWYPGVILSAEGKRVHIAFDDGDQALVTSDQIRELDISVGDRVFCRWKGGPQYFPGEVTEKDGERIHVRYDDGDEEWTSIRMVRVER